MPDSTPPMPEPIRRQGQQMSYDGWDKAHFDCYDCTQMHDYAKAYAAPLIARVAELERQNEAQKDEWLSWEAKRAALEKDAGRYRIVRRGQHWSVIDGIGNTLRADELDKQVDAAIAAKD